jgi:hypothetical protein
VTAHQKTLAEIERDVAMLDVERQKLQLEREGLQLEEGKGRALKCRRKDSTQNESFCPAGAC